MHQHSPLGDLLTKIQTASTTYDFTYGDFGLRTSVKILSATAMSQYDKPLQNDCGAIRRMLIASINTTKAKQ